MATATLEMNNPYSKLGLKRRPTYNEIINLIDENETITGNLPDRTATFYKASPEGSFFDGTDALELLKEQQNRIFQRQIQDLLLRQNVRNNGRTFNMERTRQSSSSSSSDTSSSTELQPDRGTLSIGLQADLERRRQLTRDTQQQTGDAHRRELTRQGIMPTLQSFLSGVSSPERPVPQVDLTGDETDTFRSVSSSSDSQRPRRQRRTEPSSSSTRRPFPDDDPLANIPPQSRRKNRK